MDFKFIKTIAILFMALNILTACGGFDSADVTDYSKLGDIPEGLDVDPTDPNPDVDEQPSYADGAGVYLDNLHPEISALYSKLYFHADLGDVYGNQSTTSARQGGSIILTFQDSNGNKINRYFSTGGSTFKSLEKNFWTKKNDGTPMWRGIFQGRYGAFIVIINGVFTYGDGAGPLDTMSGSVWFRKWQVLADKKLPTHECVLNGQGLWDCKNQTAPILQCWYISRGPYDCRFEINGRGDLVTRLPNYSNDTDWVKLGTFNDLNKSKTFHETY